MATRLRRLGLSALIAGTALASFELASGCTATGDPNVIGTGGTGGGSNSASGSGGDEVGFDGGHVDGGSTGTVPKTCQEAIEQQSYIGCEYWPTVTSNAGLYNNFEYAIAAANPGDAPASVVVTLGGAQAANVTVGPHDLKTIKLPWVPALKGADPNNDGTGITSTLFTKGAYKVTSSVPITLYQFNPLEFELQNPPIDCPQIDTAGACYSYTNDASLILPTTALRDEYYVMSYPTLHIGFYNPQFPASVLWVDLPGFVSITATEDGTQVEVTSTANVRSGPGVAALSPGQKGTYLLNAGDVVQLTTAAGPPQATPQPGKACEDQPNGLNVVTLCPSASTLDLTGSHIVSNKPVSVIGGHDCTFAPYNSFACDHVEESLFPIDALGQDLIVTAPRTVASLEGNNSYADNMFVRVLSAADDNKITFDPAVNADVTLNKGEWIEIGPTIKDFRVKATDKIMVGQYMVGGSFSPGSAGAGDPSFSMAIPTEQYRLEYTFLAPVSYTYNVVNIVANTGTLVAIDGENIPASEFKKIGTTGKSVARHVIAGGTHKIVGDSNFGITVYGYGLYTSYMYPGGLNLETIVVVPD